MGKKRGAPIKPPERRKSRIFPVRLTEEEFTLLTVAANGKVSRWARAVLIRAAKQRARAAERGGYDPIRAETDPSGRVQDCCAAKTRAALRTKERQTE